MKKLLILCGIVLISFFCQNVKCQNIMEDDKQDFIDGFVDHVLITLSSKDFEITDSFLQEHFNYSWLNRPWKGFLNPMIQSPYVEIFNGGYFFQYGYQVSLAGSQSDSKEKAKSYYGTNGIEYQKGGLSTVGEDGKVGHPIGGTFFVDYGINARSNKKDSTKIIEEFVGLYTTIPETKKDVLNDYSFYSFSMSNSDSIYVLKDTKGFSICLLILPIETISFSHIAMKFRLKNDSLGQQEYKLSDSIKAIISFWT